MKMPFFSIVTATFNADKHIANCLNSIGNIDYVYFEHIIIDGGSTDSTLSIIERNSTPNQVVISEKDNGIYDAWNKAIKIAKGEWIIFVGADDKLYQDSLLEYSKIIEGNPDLDLISARVKLVNEQGDFIGFFGESWNWAKLKTKMSVAHTGMAHNKRLFDRTLFDMNFKIAADYDLILKLGGSLKTSFIDKPILEMTVGGASHSIKAIRETLIVKLNHNSKAKLLCLFDYAWSILLFYRFKLICFLRFEK